MKKRIVSLCALLAALTLLNACSAARAPGEYDGKSGLILPAPGAADLAYAFTKNDPDSLPDPFHTEKLVENEFVQTAQQPVSTFSADADTASYTFFRRLVQNGYTLRELTSTAGTTLRTEEMVNYFKFDCPEPEPGKLFGIKATVAPSPFGDTKLLKLTMKTESTQPLAKNNLVFLIDVSGSMGSADKLPLLKQAFRFLTDRLGEDDTVSIVTYSGIEEVVLDGCPGNKKEIILNKIDSLTASGATNGEAGLRMAYALAEKYYMPDGNNRILLASDGDLNVGMSSPDQLKAFVSEKRSAGVFLSVLGFGSGNFRDANMEAVADNGNGVYLYVDGAGEAEKVFGEDLFANLYTVAKDVKLQISFDPGKVQSYRLIGYENRLLSNEDFENDLKDAGEIGAGRTVTVFYELRLNENAPEEAPFGTLLVRSKAPDGEKSSEESFALPGSLYTETPDEDFLFAASLVEGSMILRDSKYMANASPEHLLSLLGELDLSKDELRMQYKELWETLTAAGDR